MGTSNTEKTGCVASWGDRVRWSVLRNSRSLLGPWLSLASGPAIDQEPLAPPGGLGIDGLPDDVGQLACGFPVALLSQTEAVFNLWMPRLLEEAVATGPVCLVADDAGRVDTWLLRPALARARAEGRLRIWVMGAGLEQRIQSNGLASFLKDLRQEGLTPNHAVYVIPANRLLNGLRLKLLNIVGEQIKRWSQRRKRPVVLCLVPAASGGEGDGAERAARGLSHVFMHVATLGIDQGHLGLYLERWESAKGAVFDMRFGLLPCEADDRLSHDGSQTVGKVPELVSAPDQTDVYTTESVVDGKKGVPANWKVHETDADLVAAAAHAVAATVLLDAGQAHEFDAKARLVHQLRLTHPRTLRILVRETQGKLRANFEQALLRLGADEIFYKEMGFPRVLQFLEENRRLVHAKEVHPEFERAMGGFLPVSARGYSRPSLFCDLVQSMLESTQGTGVGHSYVQLQLLPRMPHMDAIWACRVTRNGDLMTADENAIHLFLFACQEPDLEMALARLFACPLSQLFISQVGSFTDDDIHAVVKSLSQKARRGLPDFSPALEQEVLAGVEQGGEASAIRPSVRSEVERDLVSSLVMPSEARPLTVSAKPIARCKDGKRGGVQPGPEVYP